MDTIVWFFGRAWVCWWHLWAFLWDILSGDKVVIRKALVTNYEIFKPIFVGIANGANHLQHLMRGMISRNNAS